MTDLIFKHHRDTTNLGDAVCSPFDYYPELAANGKAVDLACPTPRADAVIYGGGKIMGGLAKMLGPEDYAAKTRIAWGVSTLQKFPISLRYWRAFRAMHLIGSRDWGDNRFPFAPCVTCVSPAFDAPPAPRHDVVLYLHHWRSRKADLPRPDGVPVLENNNPSFAETIRHIASGQVVVTNSYHGTYWALLLGRKVLCLPFSNKFSKFRVAPGYATPANWQAQLGRAQASDEMLGLCREATAAFRASVTSRIGL
ncbi:hypothetical protein ACEN2J_13420 [Pseudorhodobacter sp. W20_MBD10_FR17]|uniref:hypothetical protein n=1 Tax=Pseudorhodobacter sp. W20_MBD10_FR17 TaxID=3240266 RepID=UPI003F98A931